MKFRGAFYCGALLALQSLPGYLNAAVPAGFAENRIASGLSVPSALEIAPDGRLFVTQQNGVIRVIKQDTLLPTPFATLAVDSTGERGLLGITLDPNFATNHFVYVYYTALTPTPHNRLSRLIANGDQMQPGSEVTLLDLPDIGTAVWHMGGAIQFGPDGKLYISVGEYQDTSAPQSLNSLLGKILRINSNGTIPSDNPFYNQLTGINRAIWAYGLRNPFTTSFQPGTGRFFINDVGESSWEEINEGQAGANYGWPTTEGDFVQSAYPDFVRPFFTYSHAEGCAVTGGAFYNPVSNQFGAAYVGQYFFVDYCGGWIRMLDPVTRTVSNFASNLPAPINLRVSPDGALYYVARGVLTGAGDPTGLGSVWKTQHQSNQSPVINVPPASSTVAAGSSISFTVSASGSTPLHYQWQRDDEDIPDATSASYALLNASEADNGAQFRVIVTNDLGTATSAEATLTVPPGSAPTATITSPAEETFYTAGDTISFSGTATDPDDGDLPPSAYTWKVDFQHDLHAHPFVPFTSGITGGSFVIPTIGETSDNVWYRIYLTVTDSTGLTFTTQRDVLPRKARITLATDPPGFAVKLDGQPVTGPIQILGVVGMTRTLAAYSQGRNGVTYDFTSWSDNAAAAHVINFPPNDTTYTASYRTTGTVYLSDLNWIGDAINFWGPPEKDQSNGDKGAADGLPITLKHVVYPKGLGVHAPSQLTYNLGRAYSHFISDIGVDDETNAGGSVVFQVWVDSVKLFDSGTIKGTSATRTVDVNVTGKSQLQLTVTNNNDGNTLDHADWAGARLTQASISPSPTPTSSPTPTPTPDAALANGDFETGPFDVPGFVTGWNVSGTRNIEILDAAATSPSHSAAFGTGGDSEGNVLFQTFATTFGQTYLLDFDAGINGQRIADPLRLHAQVIGTGLLLDQMLTPPEPAPDDPGTVRFEHYQFMFTANGTRTTVEFSDVGLGNVAADTILDTVSITSTPTPTPTATPSAIPSATPTPTATPSSTPTPTASPTPAPTPTSTPTSSPASTPTPTPTAAPLLVNGDFESAPFDVRGLVSGWNVSGNGSLRIVSEGATSASHAAGFNTGGDSQGNVLSQTFTTIIGQTYMLDFDAGIAGKRSGNPLQLRAQVLGSGTLLDQTLTPPEIGTFTPSLVVFEHYHFVFTATSTQTTLQFSDIGLGNAAADPLLDSVSVTPASATPTPSASPTSSPTPSPTTTPTATPSPTPSATPSPTPTPTPGTMLINGDFETGPFKGAITGWVESGTGNIELVSEGATTQSHAAGFNTGGDSQGSILSQTFSTAPGRSYMLDFDAGVAGKRSGSPLKLRAQVLGTVTLVDQTVTPPEAGTFNPALVTFQHYHFVFTANSTGTTVQFSDIGLGNAAADLLLDTVSVAVSFATPSPTPTATPTPTPTPPVLVNGNFEATPYNSAGVITGWTVSGARNIEATAAGATSSTHSAGFNTGGDSQGNILSQTFATVNGKVYGVDFDAGIIGKHTGVALKLRAQIIGTNAATLLDQTVTPLEIGTYTPSLVKFQHFHFQFTANGGTAKLQLTDIGLGNAAADTVLDTVSIVPVP